VAIAHEIRNDAALYLRNAWYPAAWLGEIGNGPFGRTILDEPIVIFRDMQGTLSAIGGRCPHRFAPLRLGRLIDGKVQCPYHGLMFDRTGRCVVNPHDRIVPKIGVPAYPLAERYGLAWLWFGEAERADSALLPDFPFLEDPEYEFVRGTIHGEGHYELYTDNILDLSHAAYLHTGLNAPAFVIGKRKFEQEGNRVWTRIFHPNDYASEVTSFICDVIGKKQDHWVDIRWDPPAAMTVTGFVADPGQPKTAARDSPSMHIFTPENDHATYYFWAAAWRRRNDPQFTEAVRAGFLHAFENEDKPMILEQSRMMRGADFWSLNPVLLRGDAGAVRARRTLARLISEQQGIRHEGPRGMIGERDL
jgi:phenylpropionate dioxygenase-like ring-hydroxylating dioxygenase large terminal subunit